MMYTKEGEYEVALTGGSPWGFTIRTQSGNGYNRGRVIVAKVERRSKWLYITATLRRKRRIPYCPTSMLSPNCCRICHPNVGTLIPYPFR